MSNRKGASEWWVEGRGYEEEQDEKARLKMARHKMYEVLHHYGYEKKKGFGTRQWLRCPFHDDTHASAVVNWVSGFFTCFACDMRGNAVDLVMQKEGLSLDDAVRRVELL